MESTNRAALRGLDRTEALELEVLDRYLNRLAPTMRLIHQTARALPGPARQRVTDRLVNLALDRDAGSILGRVSEAELVERATDGVPGPGAGRGWESTTAARRERQAQRQRTGEQRERDAEQTRHARTALAQRQARNGGTV